MLRLWAFLTALFVAYGAWMVAAAPEGARIVSGIPFLFWTLLFAWLAFRAKRANKIVRGNVYPYVPKIVRQIPRGNR